MNFEEQQPIPAHEEVADFCSRIVTGWQRGYGVTPMVVVNTVIFITAIFYILGCFLIVFLDKFACIVIFSLTAIYVIVVIISLRLLIRNYSRAEEEYGNQTRSTHTV